METTTPVSVFPPTLTRVRLRTDHSCLGVVLQGGNMQQIYTNAIGRRDCCVTVVDHTGDGWSYLSGEEAYFHRQWEVLSMETTEKIKFIKKLRELASARGVTYTPCENGSMLVSAQTISLKDAKDFVEEVMTAEQRATATTLTVAQVVKWLNDTATWEEHKTVRAMLPLDYNTVSAWVKHVNAVERKALLRILVGDL